MNRMLLIPLLGTMAVGPAGAQNVVVDEGTFVIVIHGERVGTEEFAIRRSGLGSDGTLVANAVVSLRLAEGTQELRPLLQASGLDEGPSGYGVKVSGVGAAEVQMRRDARRYVSVLRSERGEEEREFLARSETRILDTSVAHHYWFVRTAREGAEVPVIEPRSRAQARLLVGPWSEVSLTLGHGTVEARRVEFGRGEDVRVVFFDRQGRVLRVEIPARGYVAERSDLVG